MSKNQQISSFLGFYFIVGMPLREAISYLLQYDHVIPVTDARRLINTYYYYYSVLYLLRQHFMCHNVLLCYMCDFIKWQ